MRLVDRIEIADSRGTAKRRRLYIADARRGSPRSTKSRRRGVLETLLLGFSSPRILPVVQVVSDYIDILIHSLLHTLYIYIHISYIISVVSRMFDKFLGLSCLAAKIAWTPVVSLEKWKRRTWPPP